MEIELKNVENLELGKEKECSVTESEYFTFTPQISSEVIFGTESQDAFAIELYDDDNKLLAQTTDSDNFSQYVERGKKYYVLVKNYSHADGDVKIYTRINPVSLNCGNNETYQQSAENCYSFTSPVTAEFSISLTANVFEIFNSAWKRVTAADGKYALSADSNYFIIIKGAVKEFTVNIDLCSTEGAEGVIPESGEITLNLSAGEYSFDLAVNEPTSAGLIIKP
ncbi:MAG: hypothetical protein K2N50_00600, partial [Clostridia bacterium]|nr:hypothetical protein [Clostridia bacterium]